MAVNLLSVNSGGQARSLDLTEQCAIISTSNRYYVRSMFDLSFKERAVILGIGHVLSAVVREQPGKGYGRMM